MLNVIAPRIAFVLLATFGMTAAADVPPKPATALDLNGKTVKRQEVSSSPNGLTSTTVFYALDEHRVVVVIHVDNTREDFPVTGKVFAFAEGTDAEGIARWLNNQHSDGLFPNVPEPTAKIRLPAEACQSLEGRLLGERKVIDTTYSHHRVGIKISEVTVNERFRLKEHEDTVNVFVAKD